jgi:hypothetical protein
LIYFFADNHFEARPGFHLHEKLKTDFEIKFFEDDISVLSKPGCLDDCSLLMINMICGIGKLPQPSPEAEAEVKKYCVSGRPLFLIHAGSAAFTQWDWWRRLTGLRWVRENDPEGLAPSVHPVKDFMVRRTEKEIVKGLKAFTLKNDEIYTNLAQTADIDVLLETEIDGKTCPMAFKSKNEWGGKIMGFLPGHLPKSFENQDMLYDIELLIKSVL